MCCACTPSLATQVHPESQQCVALRTAATPPPPPARAVWCPADGSGVPGGHSTMGRGGGGGRPKPRDGRFARGAVATCNPARPVEPYPVRPVQSTSGTQTVDTRHLVPRDGRICHIDARVCHIAAVLSLLIGDFNFTCVVGTPLASVLGQRGVPRPWRRVLPPGVPTHLSMVASHPRLTSIDQVFIRGSIVDATQKAIPTPSPHVNLNVSFTLSAVPMGPSDGAPRQQPSSSNFGQPSPSSRDGWPWHQLWPRLPARPPYCG